MCAYVTLIKSDFKKRAEKKGRKSKEIKKEREGKGLSIKRRESGLITTVGKNKTNVSCIPTRKKSKENHNKIKKTNKPETRIYHVR